jgi:hypothetical protein
MVLWDRSPHHYLGSDQPPCCLMAAMDDSTAKLLVAGFFPSKGAAGYLWLLKTVVKGYGVPGIMCHAVSKASQKLMHTACRNNTDFLQYCCSNFVEKMGDFEVRTGNKKKAGKFYDSLIRNRIFFECSHLAGSSGLNSNIKNKEWAYHEARRLISKCQSKLEKLDKWLKN